MEEKPVSVIGTPEFLTATRRIMDDEERAVLIDYLACNPGAGDLIRGTDGVRKLRWGLAGRGKHGGAHLLLAALIHRSVAIILLCHSDCHEAHRCYEQVT